MKQERHELQFPICPGYRGKPAALRIGNEPETLAFDETLCAELADVEANPLGELSLLGMNDAREKRIEQLAFMMHTKNRAIQMTTRLSDAVNGLEIWRRFLEEWEPVDRGRYLAMLMQLLQFPLTERRGQALEECECPVWQCEAQNVDTLRDTIKAAILARNPQDSEWCRCVRLSATRLQEYDALKSMCREKGKSKRKGKEKGKSKYKLKEGTGDTSNTKCSFCKGKDRPKSLIWPAEKKTMSHELSKLTLIDSDASIHLCPLNNGQGDGFRKSSATRPLPGAEMQQLEIRQMNCDSEAGRVTVVNSVLDMRRSIWSLRSMLDSGCDVYFAKDRRWIAKNNGKELDVILSSGVFFVATKLSKPSSKKRSVLELNSTSQA